MSRHLTLSPAAQPSLEAGMADFPPASDHWRDLYSHRSKQGFRVCWAVSGVLHVVLVLLLSMMLLPANLGDSCTILLEVSMESEEAPLESFTSLAAGGTEAQPDSSDTPWELSEPLVEEGAVTIVTDEPEEKAPSDSGLMADASESPLLKKSANDKQPSDADDLQEASTGKRGGTGGEQGPRAEYFGTVAYGDRLAYILDMSGSMDNSGNGATRFQRASAELIRSVEQLREDQWFYVVLFSDHTRRMFDDNLPIPLMVQATPENKARLKTWLRGIDPSGDTDPRQAMRLALSMRPSAVFMLSDGEFNGQIRGNGRSVLRGNRTVEDVVANNNPGDSPIHSFAYEDKHSCANMRALAKQTGGAYRYIPPGFVPGESETVSYPPPPPTPQPKKPDPERRANMLLHLAMTMEKAGKAPKALERYRDLAEEFPNTAAGQAARECAERLDGL